VEELWSEHELPPFPFWENIERRPVDQRLSPLSPAPNGATPTVREWARFRPVPSFEDPFVDAARSLILLDTYGWPAVYRLHRDGAFVAPNLDTSVWFHDLRARPEWLLIDHECLVGAHGLLGVNGRVWDRDGRLLASGGAQLCCLPVPAG